MGESEEKKNERKTLRDRRKSTTRFRKKSIFLVEGMTMLESFFLFVRSKQKLTEALLKIDVAKNFVRSMYTIERDHYPVREQLNI